ncbi:MAG: TIGR01777 family oxidoreductase [Bacteroidia bacterium]|nr:TIGR01777 family oxidoreductase [Bacteroidia bacterium]MBT8269448.1 TIGR01777 family oxidoreductase [Bacteroidia bacterium]NNK71435.1 TIGR01777 family protein [Flavobacteriaceae bacterium]NNL80023.1 TIGR01777 family protein [Flavobacteriaceae bacterium]
MKKILITGATGLIGKELIKACHAQGISINYLSTNRSKLKEEENLRGFYWNPIKGEIDSECFEGVSAVINLAGAPIAKRWTESYKKLIIDSRVKSVQLLHKTIHGEGFEIEHFITASAIGIYPPSEMEFYEEDHAIEKGDFVSEVVRLWENAAGEFKNSGIPVTCIRIGLVLSDSGGVLEKISKPIKNFVGSGLGSGKQWQSWIHIDDLVGIFMYCLNKNVYGEINAVAPNAVIHNVLIKSIADSIGKPILLPNVPSWVLKLALGEMHVIVTKGQRVSSKKIEALGYAFKYHQLDSALNDLFEA